MATPNIKETKKQRFQLLLKLYEMSKVDESYQIKIEDLAAALGFDFHFIKTKTIMQYLGNEGLIR